MRAPPCFRHTLQKRKPLTDLLSLLVYITTKGSQRYTAGCAFKIGAPSSASRFFIEVLSEDRATYSFCAASFMLPSATICKSCWSCSIFIIRRLLLLFLNYIGCFLTIIPYSQNAYKCCHKSKATPHGGGFWSVLTKKMQEQSLVSQGFAGF